MEIPTEKLSGNLLFIQLFNYQQRFIDGRTGTGAWAILKNNKDWSYLPPLQPHIGSYSILVNTKLHAIVLWLTHSL